MFPKDKIVFQELVPGFGPIKGDLYSAGFDLYTYRVLPVNVEPEYYGEIEYDSKFVIKPFETVKIDCAVRIILPSTVFALIFPRSSFRAKGLICHSVYDPGFLLPYSPFVTNGSDKEIEIEYHERVLQAVFVHLPTEFNFVTTRKMNNDWYDRGGGFGSTNSKIKGS